MLNNVVYIQFELAAQNQQLIDQSPKTVKTAWAVFCEHRLTDVYGHLAKLMKLVATLPVTSTCTSTERVHSKLKLRSRSADNRMSDLVQIYVERDIAEELELGQLVSEFALNPRKLLL